MMTFVKNYHVIAISTQLNLVNPLPEASLAQYHLIRMYALKSTTWLEWRGYGMKTDNHMTIEIISDEKEMHPLRTIFDDLGEHRENVWQVECL